jgi:hypothetical protein
MIEKAIFADDLAKTFKGLVGHFKKGAEFHKAASDAHDEMSKTHAEHAAFHKGHADGLDEGNAEKASSAQHAAFHKAKGEFHKAMAGLHKAKGEHCAEMAAAYDVGDKAAGAAAGPGAAAASAASLKAEGGAAAAAAITPLSEANFGEFMKSSLVEAFGEMSKSEDFKTMIKAFVLEQAKSALRNTVVPDNVAGAIPDNKDARKALEDRGLRIISRPGTPEPQDDRDLETAADELDPELRKAIV